jgi:hypothetical protein
LRALDRAESLAEALVDSPLDDPEIGSLARQMAAVRALDATFPLQSMSVEVEMPANSEQVGAMGWDEMRKLAQRMLEQKELDPG